MANEDEKFIFKGSLFRVALLVVAMFIISAWINSHLENFKLVSWVLGTLTALYGFAGLLDKVATEADKKTYRGQLQKWLLALTATRVLVILYLIILFVGNLVSSVSVSTGNLEAETTVVLGADDENQTGRTAVLSGPNKVKSFLVLTNPFGSSRYLDADRYLREHFLVFPWVGKRIVINDLAPAPSILFRAPRRTNLIDSGYYVFTYNNISDTVRIAEKKYSLLVGINQSVPGSVKSEWREELSALALGEENIRGELYNSWKHNMVLEKSLKPGATYKLSLYNKSKTLLHELSSTVPSVPLQDILLESK